MVVLLDKVREAVNAKEAAQVNLRRAAIERMQNLEKIRKQARKTELKWKIGVLRKGNTRLARVVQGIAGLSEICMNEDLQSLMSVSKPITLWNGHIHLGSNPECGPFTNGFGITINVDSLVIEEYVLYDNKVDPKESFLIRIPYESDRFLVWMRLRRHISLHGCDPQRATSDFERVKGYSNTATPMEIMLQVFADCSNPRMLEKYLLPKI